MAGIGTWALDDALKVVQADERETALGTLKRIDREGVAWVTLGEGAGEFPADLGTATANPGDSVTVRIRDGRASITGNATDRSASSSETRQAHSVASQAFDGALRASSAANAAEQLAQGAKDSADSAAQAAERAWDHADDAATAAQNAWDHADSAATAAGNAWDRAGDALTAARSAQASANAANTYSNAALDQLAVVQDVAGILTWASEHGSFELTQDQSIVDGKVYFTYDSTTHDYTPVVDPQASALSTYYELTVDEAMNDFIMAHLAVTTRGLWVLPAGLPSTDQTVDNTVDKASSSDTSAQKQANANARKADDYKVLLSNDGLYVYDGDGVLVSTFGESITFSSLRQQYIGNEDAYILFTPASGNDDASITIGGANVTLGSSKKLSELLEEVDAKAARGTGILHVTTAPSSYTTTQGGFTPSYRMSLSTAKSQAGVAEVIVGDIVEHDSWHYPVGYVSSSYVYMGERVSIKGAQGETGGTGSQGVAGLNQATVYLYKRADSASKPTSGTSTYTFSTGVLTGVPSGWSQTFPAETQGSTTPVWMMCAVASANTATDDIGYSEWTTPIKMVSSGSNGTNGANGTNGYNTATVYLYQRKSSQPSKPSNTLTYTFSSHSITSGTINNGWSTSIPSTGDDPLWVTAATATGTGTTDTIASSDWATPVQLAANGANGTNGTNGTNGLDGLNTASIYLYQRAASSPSLPSSAVTYTFATGALSSVPMGWSRSVPTVDGNPCWVTSAVAISSDATDSIAASEWVTPAKMAEDGDDGYNRAVVTLYQRASSTPSKPSGTVTYTFSTGTLSPVPSGWSTAVPSGTNPCYVTQAACVSQSDTYSISSSAWSSPVKLVEDGAKGDTGPEAVVDVTFDSVDWAAGSATLRASLLVNGSAPSGTVTYQWRKNGSNVSGETSQIISIGSGTGDMTAVWSCAVTWDGYTQAGSIDLAPLAQAAAVAGNYIVETASNDVWIHSEGHGPDTDPNSQTYGEATQDTYGWRIGSVFELVRAGLSYLKMWVDNSVAKVRVGLENAGHSVFSPDGMEVFAGTNGGNSVALFGGSGARIGKSGNSHLELDYHSMQLIDKEGNTYFHVSDLRDADGYLAETFVGDGSTTEFTIMITAFSIYSVKVGGTSTSNYTRGGDNLKTFIFPTAPASGSEIEIRYEPTSTETKGYTFGKRLNGTRIGLLSIAEGYETTASGNESHAEGYRTTASAYYSHAEGYSTTASGNRSHAEGSNSLASGANSHAEGWNTSATGLHSHSEGYQTTASGTYGSHAEGYRSVARGDSSHAEGDSTVASGTGSHARGVGSVSSANYSSAIGRYSIAASSNQVVIGKYNVADTVSETFVGDGSTTRFPLSRTDDILSVEVDGQVLARQTDYQIANALDDTKILVLRISAPASGGEILVTYDLQTYSLIVGNGTSSARSNALTLDWNGVLATSGGFQLPYGSQIWDNSNCIVHMQTPDAGTLQAEFTFEPDGKIYRRTRTRTSDSTSWGSWTNWLCISDRVTISMGAYSGSTVDATARASGANYQVNITVDARSGCVPFAVCAVTANNANADLRGFDLDGISVGGTATVKTYWRANAALTASSVTYSAQVGYINTTIS